MYTTYLYLYTYLRVKQPMYNFQKFENSFVFSLTPKIVPTGLVSKELVFEFEARADAAYTTPPSLPKCPLVQKAHKQRSPEIPQKLLKLHINGTQNSKTALQVPL